MAQFESTILSNLALSKGDCLTYRECALFASSKILDSINQPFGPDLLQGLDR